MPKGKAKPKKTKKVKKPSTKKGKKRAEKKQEATVLQPLPPAPSTFTF